MEKQIENKKFKFTSELTLEDIRKLERRQVTITCKTDKVDTHIEYKNIIMTVYLSDRCILKLQQDYSNKSKVKPIKDREFAYLKAILKKGDAVNRIMLNAPIRFVKGIDKNDHVYHRVVVFLAEDLVKSIFLNKIDLNMLSMDGFDSSLWEVVEVAEIESEADDDSVIGLFD